MSGLLLYCIAGAGVPPSGLEGVDSQPVESLDEPPFTLWVSRIASRPGFSVAAAEAHNRVVTHAVAAASGALPVRFGQWFADEAELCARVREHRTSYEASLRLVAGAEEHGVRVLDPAALAAARDVQQGRATSGRQFLESLAARDASVRYARERARAALGDISVAVAPFVRGEKPEALDPRVPGAGLLHLVGFESRQGYSAAVEQARLRHADLRFLVSGPWPPYSFVA